jgi:hypothetical protein
MTAHVLIPAYDTEQPATLSKAIVDTLLKKRLGYGGLVLTDDIEMKAISARYGVPEATVGRRRLHGSQWHITGAAVCRARGSDSGRRGRRRRRHMRREDAGSRSGFAPAPKPLARVAALGATSIGHR